MGKTLSLAIACCLLLSSQAYASEKASDNWHDDRFELSVGGFAPHTSLKVQGDVSVTDQTDVVETPFSTQIKDDGKGGWVQFSTRLSKRQYVHLGWYGIEGKERFATDGQGDGQTLVEVEGMDPVLVDYDYTYQSQAELKHRLQLYHVSYGFAFLQGENYSVQGLLGVYGAKGELRGETHGQATVDAQVDGESVSDIFVGEGRFSSQTTKYAPSVGLKAQFKPHSKWDVRGSIEGFKTTWGDFGQDGRFYHAQVQVGYRLSDKSDVFVGYDWFNLKLKPSSQSFEYQNGETVLNADLSNMAGRLKTEGAVVGFRTRF